MNPVSAVRALLVSLVDAVEAAEDVDAEIDDHLAAIMRIVAEREAL